jgi:predicted ATPase
VLVYFGYPEAHEDDAERAVRAGLALIGAVGRLDVESAELEARIGIATGLVVVGDLIGEGSAREQSVVGETPNRAARLQALAAPGTLVVDAGARRQIGGLFELEDLGAQPLAGFAAPQPVWRVIGDSGVVSRFEALRSAAAPLVGRDEELDLLLGRWQQAKAGEGRVVLVSSEPGIGKSRLTAELGGRIANEPHTRLRFFCSPYHQDSALYPSISQLERAAGFAREDTAEAKLGKLRSLLTPGAQAESEIELSAELLSLPSSAADLNLSPRRKREMLFEALVHQFEALARSGPVLMIYEDAQWIDPTSRELLDLTLSRIRRMPVLIVVTFRPEFQHAWSGQPHVTVLALDRLRSGAAEVMVERLASDAGLSRETVGEIVERADGVPLFIEELTKAVLETGERDDRVAAVLAASPLPNLSIPAPLHASLMSRLDRLGPIAREVGQIGAAIGREFGYELIEAVAQRPAAELRAGLDRLAEAGLLFCRGTAPHSSYLFKHALVQDAAYGTLLRTRRQELHARVAAVLEEHFADLVGRHPELLARHLTAAGEAERAVDQWLTAGRHAAGRSAHREAIGHFERGLATLAALSDGLARDRREIDLNTALGRSLTATKGYAAVETGAAYARARRLCENLGDTSTLMRVGYGQFLYHLIRAEPEEGHQVATEILAFAEKAASDEARVLGRRTLGVSLFELGKLAAARNQLQTAATLLEQHQRLRIANIGDSRVAIPAWLAVVLAFQGHLDQAILMRDLSVKEANASTSLHSRAFGLSFALSTSCLLGEFDELLAGADAVFALATELNFPFHLAWALAFHGIANAYLGNDDGKQATHDGLALYRQTESRWALPFWLGSYVSVQSQPTDEAMAMIRDGLAAVEATGERWFEAELYRLRGNQAQFGPSCDLGRAEQDFRAAKRIAAEQGAKLLELRAAVSLARLWGEQGRLAEARDLLAPVYGWFTEGFGTVDLKEAKTLLDRLN